MSERLWRGGMIGSGAWSAVQLTAWAGVPNAQIAALADRHPDRRDPIVRQFKIPQAYDDFVTMLDRAELNFVDICTRPYSHAMLSRLAAERGLPILCQKPFCRTLAEAQAVDDYCRSLGVRIMVNENFRWQPWFRKIKELLQAGAVGQPFFGRFYQRRRLSLPTFHHDQTYFKEMPLLLLYEVGTHLLDVTRYLFGEPDTIYARTQRLSPDVKGEDMIAVVAGYSHFTLMIHDSWASVPVPETDRPGKNQRWFPRLLEIEGTEGTLVIKPDGSVHLYTDTDQRQWEFPADSIERSYIAAQQHFVDCLESGAEFETSVPETIKTMALVYAGYRSAETGEIVQPQAFLEEALRETAPVSNR